MWAYTYFSKTKKYAKINVDKILNFDPKNEDFSDKKVYSVQLTDGSQAKCQVLLMAATLGKLDDMIKAKRVTVPKLSHSMFEDEPDASTTCKTSLSLDRLPTKKQRSEHSHRQQTAARETSESIISAYIDSRKSPIGFDEDQSDTEDDVSLIQTVKKNRHGSGKMHSQSQKEEGPISIKKSKNVDQTKFESQKPQSKSTKMIPPFVKANSNDDEAKSASTNRRSQSASGIAPMGENEKRKNDEARSGESSDATIDGLDEDISGNEVTDIGVFSTPKHRRTISESPPSPEMFDSEDHENSPTQRSSTSIATCKTTPKQLKLAGKLQATNSERRTDKQIDVLPNCSCWIDSESDNNDTDYDEAKSKGQLLQKVKQLKCKVKALTRRNSNLKQFGLQLRDSYNNLKLSRGYALTEATGQRIVDLVGKLRTAESENNSEDDMDESRLTEKTRIGSAVLKNVTLSECSRSRSSAKFVMTLAYGLWGYKKLANRSVREQSNMIGVKCLTPEKKEFVATRLKEWLIKRQCGELFIVEEMKNLNTYLGRAISSAARREKTGPRSKKPETKDKVVEDDAEDNAENVGEDVAKN